MIAGAGLHHPFVTSPNRTRDFIEYLAFCTILKILKWLPLRVASNLARGLADLVNFFSPKWRHVAHRNLNIALPDTDLVTRQRIIDGTFQNLGRILVALSRMSELNSKNIHDWIRYEGYEHFQQALRHGRGILFMTAHLGNWELGAAAHSLLGHPMHIVVRAFDNPLLDNLMVHYRTMHGNRIIHKNDYGRPLLQALRSNEAVGILVDQNTLGEDTTFVDFFGIKAASTSGLAKIAMRTGAAVIPGFTLWDRQTGSYVLKFYPELKLSDTSDFEKDLVTNTQLCQSKIEEVIRNHPDQWLWIHRRWKNRPVGEPELYL